MAGQVEADRVGFQAQALDAWPVRDVGQAQGLRACGDAAEQADLAAGDLLGLGLGATQQRFSGGEHPGAIRLDAVEGTSLGQVLQLHLVELPGLDALCEVGEVDERTGAARGVHRLHGGEAHLLHRGKGITDRLLAVIGHLDQEVGAGTVDVGGQHLDAETTGLLPQGRELVGLFARQRHAGGQERDRVVRLHPGGLVRHQGVGGGVRLVEAVIGEARHQLEHLDRLGPVDAALDRALGEDLALGVHLGAYLLAHGAAQQVGRAQAVAAHLLGDLHHLLLVDHDAVGFGQDLAQLLVRRVPLLAVLAPAIVRDVGHRAWAVQRHGGDQVLQAGRTHLPQHVAHAGTFELEHAGGVAAGQHLEGARVVERQHRQVDGDTEALEHLHAALQDGERGQAQEVELHQAGLLDELHVVLGDQHVALGVAIQRHQLVQRTVADHHAGGVGAGVAVQPFQLQRDLHQAAYRLVAAAHLLQAGLAVDGLLQRHRLGGIVRNQLANLVDHEERQAQHAADVAHRGTGLQLAEGDDLGDAVVAVLVAHVADHLVAPVLAEVDVEIGHRDAFRVQEALEQEVERDRVDVGDGERPGGERAGAGTAPGPDRDVVRLGPLDEVGDDHEVAGKAHACDHVELEAEALAVAAGGVRVRAHGLQAALQAFLGHGAQGLVLGAAFADLGTHRQQRAARLGHDGAAAGDRERVVAGLGQVGEQGAHRGRRLEPLLGRHPPAVALRHGAALRDAQQRVVRLVHLGAWEEALVGGDQGKVELVGQRDQAGFDRLLHRQAVALDLDAGAAGKGLRKGSQKATGLVELSFRQQAGERAAGAAGKQDQAVGVGAQGVKGDAGIGRVAAEEADGGQVLEVGQTGSVLCQQHKRLGSGDAAAAGTTKGDLAADDRLHALRGAVLGEFQRAEQVAVVGDRDRRHAGGLGQRGDLGDADRTLAQ